MTAVRAVLVRQVALALILALFITLVPTTPAEAVDSRTPAAIRNRIEYLINRQRARHGLRRLRINDKTQYYARRHANNMEQRRTLYHDPNFGNEIPGGCYAWAENVGVTGADNAPRSAMTMFMNSSSHRSNILSRRMTHMGIGVAKGGGKVWIVQRFIDRRG
jgi:uncharacterized protein YkwD